MNETIGIRKEDKNKWERRSPIIPEHVKFIKEKYGIKTIVQPSSIRVFSEEKYRKNGARIDEDLSKCNVIFGIKEIPQNLFQKNKTYVFFSHTIKCQKYNMSMLKRMMEEGCNLIDYEKITDKNGRRLVFFGRYAGLAGMIDTLWGFGKRLEHEKIKQPFSKIKKTVEYSSLEEAKNQLKKISDYIKKDGLPSILSPLIVGFAGYGNVSKGAQEIIDLFPIKEIEPSEIKSILKNPSNKHIYKVVFKEKDMVEPKSPDQKFELYDYYNNPEKYHSVFEKYAAYISILMNCIYWEKKYPRLITKKFINERFYDEDFRLKIIGDISVDIEGAIEITSKTTNSGMPVFVYNPLNNLIEDGYSNEGVIVMAVDNLPCELPKESSNYFSNSLIPFIEGIIKADYAVDFKSLDIPSEIKKAVILHKGKLTPDYKYIKKFL